MNSLSLTYCVISLKVSEFKIQVLCLHRLLIFKISAISSFKNLKTQFKQVRFCHQPFVQICRYVLFSHSMASISKIYNLVQTVEFKSRKTSYINLGG